MAIKLRPPIVGVFICCGLVKLRMAWLRNRYHQFAGFIPLMTQMCLFTIVLSQTSHKNLSQTPQPRLWRGGRARHWLHWPQYLASFITNIQCQVSKCLVCFIIITHCDIQGLRDVVDVCVVWCHSLRWYNFFYPLKQWIFYCIDFLTTIHHSDIPRNWKADTEWNLI